MNHKMILAFLLVPLILTGCMQSKEPELTPEELEHNALVEWFETGMGNEDKFPTFPTIVIMQGLSDLTRTDLSSPKCGRSSTMRT